jgi:DNA-3-methyladenine glycosylase II
MASLIRKHGPCLIQPWTHDLFTALVSSIVSQQLSTRAAATIFNRVKTLCDTETVIEPGRLVKQDHEDLRNCGLSTAKTRYVLGLAEAASSRELDFQAMPGMTDEEIHNALIGYAGIGHWTIEMFLIFAIGSADILSTADLGLQRGMKRYLGMDEYPDKTTFITHAEQWRPYRSIACWYLWRMAE